MMTDVKHMQFEMGDNLLAVDCRAVPNILFGQNSRPNSVFVFGQIVMQKIHRM